MKAVRVHEWCSPRELRIEDVERPEPKAGEVLIKVNSAALNFPDLLLIAGKYQLKPEFPFTPGLEIAGAVESVGDGVEGVRAGQRVMAQIGLGGFAEYAVAPRPLVHVLPDEMSDD